MKDFHRNVGARQCVGSDSKQQAANSTFGSYHLAISLFPLHRNLLSFLTMLRTSRYIKCSHNDYALMSCMDRTLNTEIEGIELDS